MRSLALFALAMVFTVAAIVLVDGGETPPSPGEPTHSAGVAVE